MSVLILSNGELPSEPLLNRQRAHFAMQSLHSFLAQTFRLYVVYVWQWALQDIAPCVTICHVGSNKKKKEKTHLTDNWMRYLRAFNGQ